VWIFGRYLDVDGDVIPTAPSPDPIRHARAPFHPWHHRAKPLRAYPRNARLCRPHPRWCAEIETAQYMCRGRCRPTPQPPSTALISFGSTAPAMDDAIGLLEAPGQSARPPDWSALPFHSSVGKLPLRQHFVYVARRTAMPICRSLIVHKTASIRSGWSRSCTTPARRSPRASSPAPSRPSGSAPGARSSARGNHDGGAQKFERPSPRARGEVGLRSNPVEGELSATRLADGPPPPTPRPARGRGADRDSHDPIATEIPASRAS